MAKLCPKGKAAKKESLRFILQRMQICMLLVFAVVELNLREKRKRKSNG